MGTGISGVILSGGKNKRFDGITKSKIVIGDRTIISSMIDILEEIFDEIIIVTNRPEEFKEFDRHTVTGDIFNKKGPLGGLHAAMIKSTGDAVFVFAGDMPFLNKDIIISQINRFRELKCDALIPVVSEYLEPLHAIYSNSLINNLEEFLTKNSEHAVRNFFKKIEVNYLNMAGTDEILRAFTNINSPADLDLIRKFS
jgi:molybdopterin-guanine dinucleotide biosynthesis protein A